MATITRRGPKRYQAIIRLKGYPSTTKTFRSRADALAWVNLTEGDMRRGAWIRRPEAENTTLAECLARYEREITPAKKGADQERLRIRVLLRHRFTQLAMANVRGLDIAAYRDERLAGGTSASTINRELALISHCFTIAIKEWGMESLRNPVALVRRPKNNRGRDRRITLDDRAIASKYPLTTTDCPKETLMRLAS